MGRYVGHEMKNYGKNFSYFHLKIRMPTGILRQSMLDFWYGTILEKLAKRRTTINLGKLIHGRPSINIYEWTIHRLLLKSGTRKPRVKDAKSRKMQNRKNRIALGAHKKYPRPGYGLLAFGNKLIHVVSEIHYLN